MQLHASVPEDGGVISPGWFRQEDISAELKKSLLKDGMRGNGKMKKGGGQKKKKKKIYFTERTFFSMGNSDSLYD